MAAAAAATEGHQTWGTRCVRRQGHRFRRRQTRTLICACMTIGVVVVGVVVMVRFRLGTTDPNRNERQPIVFFRRFFKTEMTALRDIVPFALSFSSLFVLLMLSFVIRLRLHRLVICYVVLALNLPPSLPSHRQLLSPAPCASVHGVKNCGHQQPFSHGSAALLYTFNRLLILQVMLEYQAPRHITIHILYERLE